MIRPASAPIHLDTSFLIRALLPGSPEAARLTEWLSDRHALAVSAVAWCEFLCGPMDREVEGVARRLVQRVVPVGEDEAAQAAGLFNHAGRRRGSLADCLIAATAMLDGGVLATSDPGHFQRFLDAGLTLADH